MPDASSLAAVRLSLELALLTVVLLLVFGTPLAWWLARGRSRWRAAVRALVSLPLVLPPSVQGFYLLL
ncbi:MAG: molybdate ABC transporter permease subunit, partial [Ottowia sp.]|nr:molybdate ABC transporter permease subunit [Ottowia sp.]